MPSTLGIMMSRLQVGMERVEDVDGLTGVGHHANGEPLLAQHGAEQVRDVRFVVHDQDAGVMADAALGYLAGLGDGHPS
jgi:hypothetical protein